jgi:exodeoxyribonuclease VII small subunit
MSKLSFEENLEKLEKLVKQLESGENSLDEAVKLYQEVIVKLMDSEGLVDFKKE